MYVCVIHVPLGIRYYLIPQIFIQCFFHYFRTCNSAVSLWYAVLCRSQAINLGQEFSQNFFSFDFVPVPGVKVERASRASGEQVYRNGDLWQPRILHRRLCPLQYCWHSRFCCVRPEEPPEERPTHQNWTMCRQLINSPSIISGKVQFYPFWKLWH